MPALAPETLKVLGGARRYRTWSEGVGKAAASVAVLYASDYGFSDRLSQTLARGITKAGVATEMLDLLSADPQAGHSLALPSCYHRAHRPGNPQVHTA